MHLYSYEGNYALLYSPLGLGSGAITFYMIGCVSTLPGTADCLGISCDLKAANPEGWCIKVS